MNCFRSMVFNKIGVVEATDRNLLKTWIKIPYFSIYAFTKHKFLNINCSKNCFNNNIWHWRVPILATKAFHKESVVEATPRFTYVFGKYPWWLSVLPITWYIFINILLKSLFTHHLCIGRAYISVTTVILTNSVVEATSVWYKKLIIVWILHLLFIEYVFP